MLETIASLAIAKAIDLAAGTAKVIVSNMFLYFEAVRDAPKRSDELRQELASLCGILDALHTALLQSANLSESCKITLSLRTAMPQFNSLLAELNSRVSRPKPEGFSRLKWPFSKDE